MTNTLQNWYNSGNISYSEKQRLNTMGVNDYGYYSLSDLRKMLECEVAAKRAEYVPERIHQINFFSTWFNNNNATVIGEDQNNYCLNLFIHEPRQGGMEEIVDNYWIAEGETTKEELSNRALVSVETSLVYGNPISILQAYDNKIKAFSHSYRGTSLDELPSIKRTILTNYYSNPDTQLKPFDIVQRPLQIGIGKHSAVYLGNGKVAHVYAPVASSGVGSAFSLGSIASGSVSGSYSASRYAFDKQGAHIGSWEDFLANTSGTVERYHPILPYKHERLIKRHIAQAVSSKEYEAGQYSLTGIFQGSKPSEGNCQHFSNRCVLGLNFTDGMVSFKRKVPLAQEIGNTNELFNNLTIRSSSELSSNQSQVDSAVQSWRNNYQGQKFEARIEVRPNPPCKIQ